MPPRCITLGKRQAEVTGLTHDHSASRGRGSGSFPFTFCQSRAPALCPAEMVFSALLRGLACKRCLLHAEEKAPPRALVPTPSLAHGVGGQGLGNPGEDRRPASAPLGCWEFPRCKTSLGPFDPIAFLPFPPLSSHFISSPLLAFRVSSLAGIDSLCCGECLHAAPPRRRQFPLGALSADVDLFQPCSQLPGQAALPAGWHRFHRATPFILQA